MPPEILSDFDCQLLIVADVADVTVLVIETYTRVVAFPVADKQAAGIVVGTAAGIAVESNAAGTAAESNAAGVTAVGNPGADVGDPETAGKRPEVVVVVVVECLEVAL